MNAHLLKTATLALLPAAMIALTSCSSTEGQGGTEVIESSSGATVIKTYTTTATVTAIDAPNRRATLVGEKGRSVQFKAGPDVINFDQLRVGDKVKATLTEEVAVVLRKQGTPPSVGETDSIALAPVGGKPGAITAQTREVTATIAAISLKDRKVTLRFLDGSTRTMKVGEQVDLVNVSVGDGVTARVSEAVAITVKKS